MADRQSNSKITVIVDGKPVCDVWEDRSGGDNDSTSTQYPRGGLGKPRALGGRQTVGNVTVTRIFDDEARTFIDTLRKRAGLAAMSVTEHTIDDEGNLTGHSETWTGRLKKTTVSDRTAASDAAETLAVEMVVEGDVAVVG